MAIVVRGRLMLIVVLLLIARVRPIGVARRRMLIVIVRRRRTRQPFGRGSIVGVHTVERLARARPADIVEWIVLPDQAREFRERIAAASLDFGWYSSE